METQQIYCQCRWFSVVIICCVFSLFCAGHSLANWQTLKENAEWRHQVTAEWRLFENPGEFGQKRNGVSLSGQSELYSEWNDGNDFIKFIPFYRYDSLDSERTHWDIREGFWSHIGSDWEIKAGFNRVFWGRTEFLNLVDVINQKDLIDGGRKAKLGQPLVHLSLVHEPGIFDFYALLGFRERVFPGFEGRLRTPIPVDNGAAGYRGSAAKNDIGLAFRWGQPVGDNWELAISFFSGVSREPQMEFDFFKQRLIPVYYHMDQLGLEAEYINEGWVFKLEAAAVESQPEDYQALVTGVEYTFGAVFESDIDITLITEYLWDGRGKKSPGFFENDLGLGLRFTFNDEQSTQILTGLMYDLDTSEKLFLVEASRRLGADFTLALTINYVMDRGQPQVSATSLRALSFLRDAGLIDNRIDLGFLAEIFRRYGFIEVITDPTFFIDPLNRLERLASFDRKLSILESDSYMQLELTYFF